MSVAPATPEFERLARETLGCACAAEVFAQVEHDRRPLAGLPDIASRTAVGGRLLIYLAEPADAASAALHMAEWIAAGRAERDLRRMSRLRLVVALERLTPQAVETVETAFSQVPGIGPRGDSNVHLHCLTRGLLGPLRSPVSLSAREGGRIDAS